MPTTGVLSVFLLCAVLPGKAGIPAALVFFDQNPVEVLLCCSFAGFFGSVVFTLMSSGIVKYFNALRARKNKGIYLRNYLRWMIKIKIRFGLVGLSLVSPLILSIPLGTFIAKKFYKNNLKIILYMSLSVLLWTCVYFLIFKCSNLLIDTLLRV